MPQSVGGNIPETEKQVQLLRQTVTELQTTVHNAQQQIKRELREAGRGHTPGSLGSSGRKVGASAASASTSKPERKITNPFDDDDVEEEVGGANEVREMYGVLALFTAAMRYEGCDLLS